MRWNPRRALRRGLPERSGDGPTGTLARLARLGVPAVAAVETVGFWTAVALPLCYVPLLLTGLSSERDAALLGALVVLHLIALSAGHAHNRD
ncbi:hypothetical protein [Haloglomus litoreum]|uniref:hypothetical protein n=1 Tax=Haloglomus litoreum TaxID=3034026 RepID=UPI0023E764B4|nr:hypothetical protein [Haloglomus sp. DT116]